MNKTFCQSCGQKNIYEITQPKFCAGCGAKIGGGFSESAKNDVNQQKMDVSFSETDEVGSHSFDLEKMRRGIVAEANTNGIKLGDIVGSSSSGGDDEFKRDASNLPDGEAILEQSKRDCGSSKSTDIDA